MNMIEFQHNWEFDIRPFSSYNFDEMFCSEAVKLVHNDIGFEWKLGVKPGGVKMGGFEHRDRLGVFHIYWKGLLGKLEDVRVVEGLDTVEDRWRGGDFEMRSPPEKLGLPGPSTFRERTFEQLIENGTIKEKIGETGKYSIKLAAQLRIPEEHFVWQKIMERKKEGILMPAVNMAEFYSDVAVVADDPTNDVAEVDYGVAEVAEVDESKIPDFNIKTADGFTIWCHKNVLSEKNLHFRLIMRNDWNEGEEGLENQMEAEWDKDTMMEILHFIYTDEVSNDFPWEEGKLVDLVTGAHYFGVTSLLPYCEEKLIRKLPKRNINFVVNMCLLADTYGMEILREMALNQASEDVQKVEASENFKYLEERLWDEILDVTAKRGRVVKVPVFEEILEDSLALRDF